MLCKKWIVEAYLVATLVYVSSVSGIEVGAPIQTISAEEYSSIPVKNFQLDGPVLMYTASPEKRWVVPVWYKGYGEILHVSLSGQIDHQLDKVNWVKNRNQFFRIKKSEPYANYWIMNVYEAEAGILSFIHMENYGGSGGDGQVGKTRIGLGWSTNRGETYVFLGVIIIPYADPENHNLQGIPYFIKDGWFYIFYHDSGGLTTARAPVAEVISAAQRGDVSEWFKLTEQGFNSPGLGGVSSRIGIDGISHTDAACNTNNGKCYLILTKQNWGGGDSWIKIFETANAITWKFSKTVVNETEVGLGLGYQYATIINADGKDNSIIGNTFYIYSGKNYKSSAPSIYRWKVQLDN